VIGGIDRALALPRESIPIALILSDNIGGEETPLTGR